MKNKCKPVKAGSFIETKKTDKKTIDSKGSKSINKKAESELRKNLENTMKLLQYRLNLKKQTNNRPTLVSMSQEILDIVNFNIPERPKISLVQTRDSSEQSSTTTGNAKDRKRSFSNHSSSIMEYFKQKFNVNDVDQKSVQKRLKALQALKKTQQLNAKYNSQCKSQYNLSVSSVADIGCDIGGKQVVIDKFKKK